MSGRGLIASWFGFFFGLVKGTASIMSGGGMTQMIVGLVLFTIVSAIVVIPLLVLTGVWLIQVVVGAFRHEPTASPSDLSQ